MIDEDQLTSMLGNGRTQHLHFAAAHERAGIRLAHGGAYRGSDLSASRTGELIELLDVQLFHAGPESDVHEDGALSAARTIEQPRAP